MGSTPSHARCPLVKGYSYDTRARRDRVHAPRHLRDPTATRRNVYPQSRHHRDPRTHLRSLGARRDARLKPCTFQKRTVTDQGRPRYGSTALSGKSKGKEDTYSLPLSMYSAQGVLRQDPGCAAESPAEARTCGKQAFAKYVCCGDVGVLRCGCGRQVRKCGCAPDCADQLAEVQLCRTRGFHDRCDHCRRRTDRVDAGE